MKKKNRSPWPAVGALVASAAVSGRLEAITLAVETSKPFGTTQVSKVLGTSVGSLAPLVEYDDVDRWQPLLRGDIAALAVISNSRQQDSDPPLIRFDIPAGSLGSVLQQFEVSSGIKVEVANDALRTLPSPGVSGLHTSIEALKLLLRGTVLDFHFSGPGSVTLDIRAPSEAVEVSGSLPRPSSPKFTEPLRDTPRTITVIPRAVIEAQGATSLRDVLRNVPGITYQAGEGGGGLPGDKLSLRGFSAENDIFIDGVRDIGAYTRDSFNIEQVEVIKGPASAYAGRGSTGGTINLVTKTPSGDAFYTGTLGAGNAEQMRSTIDVNQPIRSVKGAAFRLNAMATHSGVAGRDVVENNGWALAPSLALALGSPTRLTLSYQRHEQDNVPDYGLPWAAFEASPGIDQHNFYGLKNYDFEDIANQLGTAQFLHEVSSVVTLRNVTRFGKTARTHAITAPRPPNRQLQQRDITNKAFASQTMLNGTVQTGEVRHQFSSGIEFISENVWTRNQSQTANQPPTTIEQPDPNQLPLGPIPSNVGNPSDATTRTVGAYLFDTLEVGPHWLLSGGLRLDRSDVNYALTTVATGVVTELERSDNLLSWNLGATFKPRPEASIYIGATTSFNPSADAGNTGTALSASSTAVNSVNLAPEQTRHYEMGTKWDVLGSRVSTNAAVFWTEKTNARTRNLTSEPFVLGGKQRVAGVEFGASGSISDHWSALANFAFMSSDITASANPAEQNQDLALIPNKAFSVWTSYDFPWRVSVGGGMQYQDNVFRNTVNTLEVPGYWLGNAMISYAVNSHLTMRLNGNNLGDSRYVDRVGGGHYIPGPRRTVLLTTEVQF